jgi:hypothetical protein
MVGAVEVDSVPASRRISLVEVLRSGRGLRGEVLRSKDTAGARLGWKVGHLRTSVLPLQTLVA